MNKDSAEILSILRKAEFGWIADELAESIALGKQVNREFREEGSRKKVRATSIEELCAEEEITLIVTALVEYFHGLPVAWEKACAVFSDPENYSVIEQSKLLDHPDASDRSEDQSEDRSANEIEGVSLSIEMESKVPFTSFNPEFYAAAQALFAILKQLWPEGPQSFETFLRKQDA